MIRKSIRKDLLEAIKDLNFEFNNNFSVEIPKKAGQGDYSTNIAMVSSKLNKMKPRELAEKIKKQISKKRKYKKIEVAGPGFINFTIANTVYRSTLLNIYEQGEDYGNSDHGKSKKVLLEFVSANPTGPLNIVSARAAAYGDTLYRIMNKVGYEAKREFYVNDAGNQIDILAESIELRYRELLGEDIGEFPVEAYHGEYVIEMAEILKARVGTKLVHMSAKDRLDKIKRFALKELNNMQIESLEKFDVEFDNWFSEKGLREEGLVEGVLSYLAEAGCTYEQEEAIWFASTKFGDVKDRVLMKSDGEFTYFVPDIAYHITKYERGYDIIIDVLGPDHHGYVPRLKAAIKALNLDESKLEIIFLQQVNLFNKEEKIKMSKRAGKIIRMEQLIKETGKDAARFFFLDRKPSAHLNFDLELAKKKSNENPVYYCQYAHARISSIMRKAKKSKINLKKFDKKYLKRLKSDEEMLLIKKLTKFPSVLNDAADYREPHRVANYVMELASEFHKYYQKAKIINPKYKELSMARLFLAKNVQSVIRLALNVMGINAPQRMKSTKTKTNKNKKEKKK